MGVKDELIRKTRNLAKTDVGSEPWSSNLQMSVTKAADSDIGFFVVAYAVLQHARNERLAALRRVYDEASASLSRGDFVLAEKQFLALGDYSDAKQQARLANDRERQRVRREAEIRKKNEEEYERAKGYVQRGEYSAALKIFTSLGSFKDSSREAQELRNNESQYQSACSMMASRNYKGAIQSFTRLGNYKDSARKKKEAESLLKQDEYSKQIKDIDNRISQVSKKREKLLEQKKQFDKAQIDLNSSSGVPDSDGCLGMMLLGVGGWTTLCWVLNLPVIAMRGMSGSADLLMTLLLTLFGPVFLAIWFFLRNSENNVSTKHAEAQAALEKLPDNLISEYEAVTKELDSLKDRKAKLKRP